jgi:integrase
MKRRNPFPGVTTKPDRHGKLRHRLRKTVGGRKVDAYLPGVYGSTEFRAAYEVAIQGEQVTCPRSKSGTMAFLIEAEFASMAFHGLADLTRSSKRGRLDWIKKAIGDARFDALQTHHIERLMEKKGGPTAANRLRKDLSQLFRFAAKRYGFRGQNPAILAEPLKVKSGGYHTWTDEEILTFRNKFASGHKARLALEIFLFTGAARQDATALTRASIRGARLYYRRGKTGQDVDLPILPELARELAQLPASQMMLLAHGEKGKAYSPDSLGNWFRDRCREVGLNHCSAHGLRKAGARRLAEHGATEWEVMAFLAHRTARESSRYVAAANRMKLTTSGMAKLGSKHEQDLSNPIPRLDKKAT